MTPVDAAADRYLGSPMASDVLAILIFLPTPWDKGGFQT